MDKFLAENTHQAVYDCIDEELIYLKTIAAHLKQQIGVERKLNIAGGKKWTFSPEGTSWLEHYEVLNDLLERTLKTPLSHRENAKRYQNKSIFPNPQDFGESTLHFAIKAITAMIYALEAKIEKAQNNHEHFEYNLHGYLYTQDEIHYDFPTLVEFANQCDQALKDFEIAKEELQEIIDTEEHFRKLK